MRTPPRILVVDDNPNNVEILRMRLEAHGYEVVTAADGEEGLAAVRDHLPDLILLDIMMPKLDGIEVCRRLRADRVDSVHPDHPGDRQVRAEGRRRGARGGRRRVPDEARGPRGPGRACQVDAADQGAARHGPAAQLQEWNRTLEQRVADQVAQLEHLGRLKRFFSPQLAELILAGGAEDPLKSHRREVAVVFLDLRGFTAFAETAEPEEIMGVLREYHAEMGQVILAHEGTLERFAGDGMMVFFNDPVPVPDAAARAVRMVRGDARAPGAADGEVAQARLRPRTSARASRRDMRPSGPSASKGAGTTARSAR